MSKAEVPVEGKSANETNHGTTSRIYRIISYPADPTLAVIYDKWKNNEIIIGGFQRAWVWTHAQASKLIDSFLMGLPVPSVFVAREQDSGKWLVIDGQQRILTVCSFFQGKLPPDFKKDFFLRQVSNEWEGKRFEELSDEDKRRLQNCVLRVIIVEQIDPKDMESIYHIFQRLNTGGTALTDQQIRNSLYHGAFNDLIVELNRLPTWRDIFGTESPDRRMRDAELILRFFALWREASAYLKPMRTFLDSFLEEHRNETNLEEYRATFTTTAARIAETLGSRPFHLKRGINAAVCDSVMVAFARGYRRLPDLRKRYKTLLTKPSYKASISSATTDVDTVKRRLRLAQKVLFK